MIKWLAKGIQKNKKYYGKMLWHEKLTGSSPLKGEILVVSLDAQGQQVVNKICLLDSAIKEMPFFTQNILPNSVLSFKVIPTKFGLTATDVEFEGHSPEQFKCSLRLKEQINFQSKPMYSLVLQYRPDDP